MDSIESLLKGIFYNNYKTANKCGRTEVGPFTISTCDTVDCGYETAIWKGNGDIVVVDRYENREEACIGHKKWCRFCEDNPTAAYSVQLDAFEMFDIYIFK